MSAFNPHCAAARDQLQFYISDRRMNLSYMFFDMYDRGIGDFNTNTVTVTVCTWHGALFMSSILSQTVYTWSHVLSRVFILRLLRSYDMKSAGDGSGERQWTGGQMLCEAV